MRKTVIDGSNTSGFQRTVLIGHRGYIETSFGKVSIDSIALEEDAARIISRDDKKAIYRLDRLGIPLVEIATDASMQNAEQVKETALKIGEILRACMVKRGIGTIRQDVNVSIKGHDRVEIKGFQDPKIMIATIDNEIGRQLEEIKVGKIEGEVRNALPDGKTEYLRPLPGRARMYPETDLELLHISRDLINEVKKKLPRLRQDIRDELKKKGLHKELIDLVLDGNFDEFETLMKVYNKNPDLVAKMITLWRNEISFKINKSLEEIKEILNERVLEKVLDEVSNKNLDEGDVRGVLQKIANGINIEEALIVEKVNTDEIEKIVSELIKSKPGLRPNAYMGMVMEKFKGKIDAKHAMQLINKILKI